MVLLTIIANTCETAVVSLVATVQQTNGVLQSSRLLLSLANVSVQLVTFTLEFLFLLSDLRSHHITTSLIALQ